MTEIPIFISVYVYEYQGIKRFQQPVLKHTDYRVNSHLCPSLAAQHSPPPFTLTFTAFITVRHPRLAS